MMAVGRRASRLLWPLLSSPVVLAPPMSWALMVRVMVGELGEGDVWGARGVAGGVDGEGVPSGDWGRNACGPDVVVVARVLWTTGGVVPVGRRWGCGRCCGGEAVLVSVACRLMVVELFLVCGQSPPGFGCGVVWGVMLVGGADGGWRDWWWWRWWLRQWGCRLLVRLPSPVCRLVLVMVSLVVQMVGVGDAFVARGGWGFGWTRLGSWARQNLGNPYPGGL